MKKLAPDWNDKGLCPITGFKVAKERRNYKKQYQKRKKQKK